MASFKYRILFVDDELAIRQTAAQVLRSAGHEVLTAANGLEALRCLNGALPELIITDLRMPQMSGFEFLAVVRRRFPQIPTIAISGEYFTDAMPDGLLADAFLQKGQYEVKELLSTVADLLSNPPVRAFPGTKSTSPTWVPVHGHGEVVVTCPQCLRSFDVAGEKLKAGANQATCSFCQNTFGYHVDAHRVETLVKRRSSRLSKARSALPA